MKKMKKFFSSLIASCLVAAMMMTGVSAAEQYSFVQNTDTPNTYGFYDEETDQFEDYSSVTTDEISSKIYKPVSGDTLVVAFHGNGEGGVDGECNNYAQIAANRLAVTYASSDVQKALKGAYVLVFQSPDDWYHDHSVEAKAIIDRAVDEFGIKQVFVTGLSAGGLMTERMLAKYGDFFDGALFSCAAISKNSTPVDGLGGDYTTDPTLMLTAADLGGESTEATAFMKPYDLETYLDNYNGWLDAIAESNVPVFMVHAVNDPTIYAQWTEYAYNYMKNARSEAGLDGDLYYNIIDTVNYSDTAYSEHWSWVKMLNNDIKDSTGTVSTMDWLTSLSTSTNTYEAKEYDIPNAGASDEENTFLFNLISSVKDDGQKITAIEIDLNGTEVDESKLTTDMFKVTAYGTDASGLLEAEFGVNSYGALLEGTAENPLDIKVAEVSVNDEGNIELVLEDVKGVLNWSTLNRNLATNAIYSIADMELPVVEEPTVTPDTPEDPEEPDTPDTPDTPEVPETPDTPAKDPVETGDHNNILAFSVMLVLSAGAAVVLRKKES